MEQVRGRRWRDMGLRPAYALYALAAFAAATALCMVLSRGLDSVRWSILRRCLDSSEVHTIRLEDLPAAGGFSYAVLYSDGEAMTFSADGRDLRLERDVEGAALELVLTPELPAGDRRAFFLLGAAQLLLVPLCYGGCAVLCAAAFYRRRLAEALRLLEDASALAENQRAMWRQMEERGRLNAAFSHDLRTPLTVLKGHAGMLLSGIPQGELTEEEVLEEVRVMSLHIDRLESYVEAMARLRRLEDVEVRRGPTNSRVLLSDLADTAEILRVRVRRGGRAVRGGVRRRPGLLPPGPGEGHGALLPGGQRRPDGHGPAYLQAPVRAPRRGSVHLQQRQGRRSGLRQLCLPGPPAEKISPRRRTQRSLCRGLFPPRKLFLFTPDGGGRS